ncbi:FMRFamide-activated amiloride-sensitive sodium channel [Fasciola gigantica]|uniref:FMRFamide-activated amiloride-sensitive sodium channel n=1 Tax=Fasciola gigantica TaxID=46835 RepID=A0A504YIA6_FASGI|nr:FMRFamide-activated amiloride-sensitive sodium channel [Fasciola gigantica]
MTYLNGSKPVAARCDTRGRWRKFIHPQYLNCATFEPYRELRATTTSIEMYVYLDELTDHAFCPDCFSTEVKSQLSGALIVIHAADRLPNVNDKSINLKPGSLTEIRLSTVENVQKMPPYGRCSPELPESLQLYDTEYAYSEYACRESTIQNNIIQRCGCYSMEYPYNEKAGYEPCGRLPRFVNQSSCSATGLRNQSNADDIEECTRETELFLKRIMCKRTITESSFHGAVSACTMPCAFYSYEAEQSTSSWPTKAWQLTFLNSSHNRRLGVFQGPEFDVYRRAQQLAEAGNETAAIQILEGVNLRERNLLAVLINRPNFDVRKVGEKEVLSLTSLLSQTGGLFSIWMGLSMISLGEIFEFIMRCYVKVRHARQSRQVSLSRKRGNKTPVEVRLLADTTKHALIDTSDTIRQKLSVENPGQNVFPSSAQMNLPPNTELSSTHIQTMVRHANDCKTPFLTDVHENHLLWINFLMYVNHVRTCSRCICTGLTCFERHNLPANHMFRSQSSSELITPIGG